MNETLVINEENGANEGEVLPAEVRNAGGRDLELATTPGEALDGSIVPLPATVPVRADTSSTEIERALTPEEQEWDQLLHLAQFAEASGIYPGETDIDLAMKALVGNSLGLSAATSFRALKRIKDGINIPAELERALTRRAGYRIVEVEVSDTVCTLVLVSEDLTKEYGRNTYRLEDAQKAKLLGNEVWHKYRKAMMRARCSTELISLFCPDVLYWAYGKTL